MSSICRRKIDNVKVIPGMILYCGKDLEKIEVQYILEPSFRLGAAPIKDTQDRIWLPHDCGCYATTED